MHRVHNIVVLSTLILPHVASFVEFVPHRIVFDRVSLHFAPSWTRRILSSEPRRPWALQNVSLTLEPGLLTIVTGPSQSGKSCLLRLIQGSLSCTSGRILPVPSYRASIGIDCEPFFGAESGFGAPSNTVYLSTGPSFRADQKVKELLKYKHRTSTLQALLDEAVNAMRHASDASMTVRSEWAQDLSYRQLSLSECYCLQLLDACVENFAISLRQNHALSSENRGISAPVLLLDEWLDRESSNVVRRVQDYLLWLVRQWGAIIVLVTHKPERLHRHTECAKLRLYRGRVNQVLL